jgi:hypothetical protein
MENQDTILLLKECDAGSKMAVSSIDDIIGQVHDNNLKAILEKSKRHHTKLGNDIHSLLNQYDTEDKDPNPMAKGMSWIKTNVKLAMDESDATIADLMTDGCGMGVKSLNKYLNQYEAADEHSKDIAKRLINLEEQLAIDIRQYL